MLAHWMFLNTASRNGLEHSQSTEELHCSRRSKFFCNTDIHRIPVLNRNQRVVGMVTQSMVVSLLTQNVSLLGTLKDAKVSEMESILAKDLLAIKEDQKAIDAFRMMADKNVSGVAVLDGNGFLVDTLSIRDLRGIGTNAARWRRLHQSVKDYKAATRQDFPTQTPREILHVVPNDTIQRVIELMDDGNIHRVFEVEGATTAASPGQTAKLKPKHVVSQGDLLRFIALKTGVQVKFEEEAPESTTAQTTAGDTGKAEAMDTGTPRPRSDSSADVEMRGA
jgi:CBS-domain-containing membrane protein